MKNYREMADSVFERSRVIIEQKIKKRKLLQRISAAASCCCLVALLSFGAWRSGAFDGSPQLAAPDTGSGSGEKDGAPEANEPAGPSDNSEQEPDKPPQNSQPPDNSAGGDDVADPQGPNPPDEAGEEVLLCAVGCAGGQRELPNAESPQDGDSGPRALIQEPLFAELGRKYGKSSAQIILRWHIQDGNIVIPGSKNPSHIKDNFDLFDFALTDEEMARISAMDKQKRYYTSTPELLRQYAEMVPDVDGQK